MTISMIAVNSEGKGLSLPIAGNVECPIFGESEKTPYPLDDGRFIPYCVSIFQGLSRTVKQ